MSPTSVQQINAWRAAKSETEHLEFKEAKSQFSFDHLLNYCVAIGNEGGGHLLLGISNKPPRPVVGTSAYTNTQKTAFDLLNKLHFRVDIEEVVHPDGRVLVFHIPARPFRTPLQVDGTYYMRSGESLVAMTPDQLKRIINERSPELIPARRRVIAVLISLFLVALALISLREITKVKSPSNSQSLPQQPQNSNLAGDMPNEKKEPPKTENPPRAKKKIPAKAPLFAVAVETKMFVPGPSKDIAGTGLWGVSRGGRGCIMWSADLAIFIRIRNLQSTRVMITAYNLYGIGGEYHRIRLDLSEPFRFVQRGRIPLPMQMPPGSGNMNGGFFQVKFEATDFSRGYPVQAELLDRQIGEHYIEPNSIVRGWAFFEYPSNAAIPAMLTIYITDDLGHVSSYQIPDEPGDRLGDTLPRVMTYGSPIDLSLCVRQRIENAHSLKTRTLELAAAMKDFAAGMDRALASNLASTTTPQARRAAEEDLAQEIPRAFKEQLGPALAKTLQELNEHRVFHSLACSPPGEGIRISTQNINDCARALESTAQNLREDE
jgi:hypothetical protein